MPAPEIHHETHADTHIHTIEELNALCPTSLMLLDRESINRVLVVVGVDNCAGHFLRDKHENVNTG